MHRKSLGRHPSRPSKGYPFQSPFLDDEIEPLFPSAPQNGFEIFSLGTKCKFLKSAFYCDRSGNLLHFSFEKGSDEHSLFDRPLPLPPFGKNPFIVPQKSLG